MADFTNLKDDIKSKIKSNGKQEITGAVLQQTMLEMIDETDRELTELSSEVGRVSAEIYGENIVIIQHSIQYGSEPLDIFQKLEKGQSYLFKSSVPCNIEYFTKDGSYAHFFDNQTEIEFICPSDYDESKSQYLVRVGSTNGTMTISSNAKGISSKVEEVSSSVEEISSNVEDLSSKVEENVTKIVMLESSIEQEFQEAVGIAKGKIEFSSVGQIRSIPFVATKGTKFSIVINSEDSWERIGCFYEDWNNTEFRIASNIEVGKVYDVIAQVDITAIEFFLMTASKPAIELNVETCKNLSYEIQDLKNSASRQETIKLVAGVDYTKNQGNVRDNGTIESTSSYWYSSPIVAKGGDIVHITKTYGNGVNAICESNAEGSYHRPLLKYTDGVNEYRYPIERDCYITLGHQNVNTEVLFSAEILRGGEQGVKIASEGYTLNSLQLQDKTADTSFLSLSKDLDYEVTDKANIRKAL